MELFDESTCSLVALDKLLSVSKRDVVLTGKTLTLQEIVSVARKHATTTFTKDTNIRKQLNVCYEEMMGQVKKGIPIYGCNSGYGARAEIVLNQGTQSERLKAAKKISESIVHTDISVGPEIPSDVIRAAMLIRMNMLFRGVSAVRIGDLDIYRKLLNAGVTPVVHAYGGLGASGDLAHNARVLSVARQLKGAMVIDKRGKRHEAATLLQRLHIPPLLLEPKAGLGLVNGDNFSTAAAALVMTDVASCSIIADVLGAMVVEVLRGTNRSFHPFLSKVRPHKGQEEIAKLYRYLLDGSHLAYQEMSGHVVRPPGANIQDVYSLRCISQSDGFNREQIQWAVKTIVINANSVSDNPLWVTPEYKTDGEKPWQWVSGGNFFALHMGEVMDQGRKIITRLIKRNDRHLHRMVSPHTNNGLPANLSDAKAIAQCAFKGIQLQSGMFDVYSMVLAQPVTTLFGIHEESNQDITPHSLTSAILAWEGLRLLRYSLAMNLLAVAQAVDLRGGPELLSPKTQPVYDFVRKRSSYVTQERPLGGDIEYIAQSIEHGDLSTVIREQILNNYRD